MTRDLIDRMQGKENWQRREAASLRAHSKSPCMPELAEMHEETADALKDARVEIERLRAERKELRDLLVGLGAGIPAAAILRAEDRHD